MKGRETIKGRLGRKEERASGRVENKRLENRGKERWKKGK